MMQKITETTQFLKQNFFLIVTLILLFSPVIWGMCSLYYNGQVAGYKVQIETLQMQNKLLQDKYDEYKELFSKKPVQTGDDTPTVVDWSKYKSN
jgi:hypothetical protein